MSADQENVKPETTSELDELRGRFHRLELLQRVSNVIHSTLDPQEAFQHIVHEMVSSLNAASGSLVLINPTNHVLEILAAEGLPDSTLQLQLHLGEGH